MQCMYQKTMYFFSSFVIRGKKTDCAVLCTDNLTFDLKDSETSNSLLIIPELLFPDAPEISNTTNRIVKIQEVRIYMEFTYFKSQ
jgi:hypothetical protein